MVCVWEALDILGSSSSFDDLDDDMVLDAETEWFDPKQTCRDAASMDKIEAK